MPTQNQMDRLYKKLKEYKKRYLKKRYSDLDESATRLMVNSFLTDVLGYTELEDIKTEYRIRGEYADYVIQLNRKKHFIVEVKAIQLDLSEKHLRQSLNYAANEGIDWILLTNARQVALHRVYFKKPIDVKRVFLYNLDEPGQLKAASEYLVYLTKKSILKDEQSKFWARFEALEPTRLCRHLYSTEVVKFLKKTLKKKSGLTFGEDDILESIRQIIITKIDSSKPKKPLEDSIPSKIQTHEQETFMPSSD
jgi:hypothetical protein